MNVEYKIIGNTIPFSKSIELYKRSAYIGPTDDGWSEIVKQDLQMTGFESDWEGFFKLRCSGAAHPDAQKLANELKELLINVKNN